MNEIESKGKFVIEEEWITGILTGVWLDKLGCAGCPYSTTQPMGCKLVCKLLIGAPEIDCPNSVGFVREDCPLLKSEQEETNR